MARSLSTPESLQKLRTALHAKAKESPDYRFYALYDKGYRSDVLLHAYACCKVNQGAAGVDGPMLHLLKIGLEAPVEEEDEHGKKHRTTRNRDAGRGTPPRCSDPPLAQ